MAEFLDSGIILINKPVGVSSNRVANIVKHTLGAKKCGHLGTLDLEGEGLLPVTINGATRLFDFFLNKDKTYETVFQFGILTDTLDASGHILAEKPCDITKEQVEDVAKSMIGKQFQMPPQYSAKKVGGKVAYKAARSGEKIDLSAKEIEIFDIRVLDQLDKNLFKLEISCSSGTYIRSIARDMGEKLSTYGIMQSILRTKCGRFNIKDAYTLDEFKNGKFEILPCDSVFEFEKLVLSKSAEEKLLNGVILDFEQKDGKYCVYGTKFLGVGEIKEKKLKLNLRLI